jgi:hypothetical protein
MKKSLYTWLLILITLPVVSQKNFMSFGKVSNEEIRMKTCSIDTNANAVVLGDFGVSIFRFSYQNGFTIEYTRHVKIKIFDKTAFDKANFIVFLYKDERGNKEKAIVIKGFTYNQNGSEIEKTKINKENIFSEALDKNHDVVKVISPNIKEGSVIELSYTIESPFLFNLNNWKFQDDIPTIRSEYHVFIPEWFRYKNWVEGFEFVKKLEDYKEEKFSYIAEATIDSEGRQSGGMREFSARVYHWTYIAENIKAFKNEPKITTPSDYLTSVNFELLSINYPWTTVKNYTSNWSAINKTLLNDDDFGITLKNNSHLENIAKAINAQTNDDKQKAYLAYEHIKKQITLEGGFSYISKSSIREAYLNKRGNSASINLNLVALCRRMDLEAYPVIISTRNHGKIRPAMAILS